MKKEPISLTLSKLYLWGGMVFLIVIGMLYGWTSDYISMCIFNGIRNAILLSFAYKRTNNKMFTLIIIFITILLTFMSMDNWYYVFDLLGYGIFTYYILKYR